MTSSRGFMDETEVKDFVCQHEGCNRKIKTTVGALRRNPTLRCPAGHRTKYDARDFDKEIRKAEQQMDRTLRRFK